MSNTIFKSIGVVILAFITNALLSVLTDYLLESLSVLPAPEKGLHETWTIVLALSYRAVYTVLSGFIIAKLAPNKPILHALVLGIIGVGITVIATNSPSLAGKAPLWYGYTLAGITIPCLWVGVKVK